LCIPFSLHARIETMSEKMIERLATAGCKHIVYGVESGSERVRREIMKRPVTNDKIAQVFELTKQAGIMVTANYMMGVPGETLDEMRATIELHEAIKPFDFGYFVFYPYPGTALFALCRDKGYLPEDYLARPANHRASILNLPGISPGDIESIYERWTHVRIDHALSRYQSDYVSRHGETIAADFESSAAIG
ncbi:MAG: radical SAM protein, partial [Planctomycetota bacterium]|nr:radical SAM protein [Planctomycetota bacterium]